MKINLLGTFNNLDEVWQKYPEGGREGDYITVGGIDIEWNKYTNNWGDEGSESSTTRPTTTIEGSLNVYGTLNVGGDINAESLNKYALKTDLVKLTPQRVASEEAMQDMIDAGSYVAGQIYYVPEEE